MGPAKHTSRNMERRNIMENNENSKPSITRFPKGIHHSYSTKNVKHRSRKHRRGVGAIIGGMILAVIIFTSIFVFFMTMLQSQTEKGKIDMQTSIADEEKKTETFIVNTATCP